VKTLLWIVLGVIGMAAGFLFVCHLSFLRWRKTRRNWK
jgi:hypothetical protein